MGFWKQIHSMFLNTSVETEDDELSNIVTSLYVNNIEINEYNITQFFKLKKMLGNTKWSLHCLINNVESFELETLSQSNQIMPIHYYMLYIYNETVEEVK